MSPGNSCLADVRFIIKLSPELTRRVNNMKIEINKLNGRVALHYMLNCSDT